MRKPGTGKARVRTAIWEHGKLKQVPPRQESELETMLALQLRGAQIEFERWVKVIPGRKFEFDFSVMNRYWLIECDGGTWGKGGHSTHAGIHRDMVKHNLAQLHGYSTLRFDREMIESGEALKTIEEAIGRISSRED